MEGGEGGPETAAAWELQKPDKQFHSPEYNGRKSKSIKESGDNPF